MATVTLRNLGGSVVMAVPKKILSLVDLGAGSRVQVSVENNRVIIEPRKKPRYTLGGLPPYRPRPRQRAGAARTLDYKERGGKWVETFPEEIVANFLARVRTLLDQGGHLER